MPTELNLRFPDAHHVIVRLGPDENGSGKLPFTNPITDKDLRDIQWYVETYGALSLGDPDDQEAKRIARQLPKWGKALFDAVFKAREAERRFNTFQDAEGDTRLLTISAEHSAILALPWELLHDTSASDDTFLFHEQPSISIRRRVAGADEGRKAYKPVAKDSIHLLFVVSRPDDAGFLDPRADSLPVLDAIDQHTPGCVTCEFLRPPTLDALLERLEDTNKPPVDILHFDGHGVFDREGGLPKRVEEARAARIAHLEEILRDKKTEPPLDPDCPPNTGYLLFESPQGHSHFVSAEKLGANLHRHKVALVVLSACQSAAVSGAGEEEPSQPERPMGSVAVRLTATGIPSVLAMTHSVLVHTTRALFGEFYKELARHKGIGEALDYARRYLANHPEKYEVQRGPERVPLKLYDWFLPALYQQGADGALLKPLTRASGTLSHREGEDRGEGTSVATQPLRTNLPKPPEAGFFGRKRKLWDIERWFTGPTRRITLTGFGGQGKTALALEAGRWLTRTGLFQAGVFVDYSRVQARDAVAVAVTNVGSVLGESLIDAAAATAALNKTPTLVILDNLEALAPEALRALLEAAVPWSEAGGSRVLCTTRRPDICHGAYKTEGTLIHQCIRLDGLGSKQSPDDALEWFAGLDRLPPAPNWERPNAQDWRIALTNLFDRVKFHPLSIRVLAQQLKTRRPAELGERLEQLLSRPLNRPSGALSPAGGEGRGEGEDTPAGQLASLELSLDKLDEAARKVLPRLGVFQGGAFEDDLVAIAGLGDPDEPRRDELKERLAAAEDGRVRLEGDKELPPEVLEELKAKLREDLAKVPPPSANLWPGLRRQLEAAALIEAEDIPGVTVPFLRFHPTLAPMLWPQLDAAEQPRLSAAHRQCYYALSRYLYREDKRNPHQARAIAWRELPNLLHAVHAALDAGDPDAVDFADNVNSFLGTIFGLKQEAERLLAKAQAAAGDTGSQAWYLAQSNRGEQLFAAGHMAEAARVFQNILRQLDDSPTYRHAMTLTRLGRCFRDSGRPDIAIERFQEAVDVLGHLEQTDDTKSLRGMSLGELAGALMIMGKNAEARKAYEGVLHVFDSLRDLRSNGVTLGQLGTLAMHEGNMKEAANRHRAALALFQQLHEPGMEAVAWHQLGLAFQKARQWHEAERHFRESARIEEERGNLAGAAQTWNQLAVVSKNADKLDAAEQWSRKAIEGFRAIGDRFRIAKSLINLSILLYDQSGRLAEARQLAEEALAIEQTLDPGAAEIWKTYNQLAEIEAREAQAATDAQRKAELQAQAREHRRLAREAQRNFAGTRHQLRQHAPLILATLMAVQHPEQRPVLDKVLQRYSDSSWQDMVAAIHRILDGERVGENLQEGQFGEAPMILDAILYGLVDPSTLSDMQPSEAPGSS